MSSYFSHVAANLTRVAYLQTQLQDGSRLIFSWPFSGPVTINDMQTPPLPSEVVKVVNIFLHTFQNILRQNKIELRKKNSRHTFYFTHYEEFDNCEDETCGVQYLQ